MAPKKATKTRRRRSDLPYTKSQAVANKYWWPSAGLRGRERGISLVPDRVPTMSFAQVQAHPNRTLRGKGPLGVSREAQAVMKGRYYYAAVRNKKKGGPMQVVRRRRTVKATLGDARRVSAKLHRFPTVGWAMNPGLSDVRPRKLENGRVMYIDTPLDRVRRKPATKRRAAVRTRVPSYLWPMLAGPRKVVRKRKGPAVKAKAGGGVKWKAVKPARKSSVKRNAEGKSVKKVAAGKKLSKSMLRVGGSGPRAHLFLKKSGGPLTYRRKSRPVARRAVSGEY